MSEALINASMHRKAPEELLEEIRSVINNDGYPEEVRKAFSSWLSRSN